MPLQMHTVQRPLTIHRPIGRHSKSDKLVCDFLLDNIFENLFKAHKCQDFLQQTTEIPPTDTKWLVERRWKKLA